MKTKVRTVIVGLVIVIIAIFIFLAVKYVSTINKPLTMKDDEIVVVDEGDNFYSILNELSQQNKIKNIAIIKVYTKLFANNLSVLPGEHTLNKNMKLKEVIEELGSQSEKGSTIVTIPEGFTVEDIALRLQEKGICTKDEFIRAVQEYPLPSYITNNSEKRYNLEGFLFPDTYKFEVDVEPKYIVETMLSRFKEVWDENTKKLNYSESDIEKIITIASIIEKEAKSDDDRPLVSSVIYNRLKEDMPLQVDATVLYAHGYHIEEVLYSHLAIESKYNTYLYNGLPVGPISNPGTKSILAALNPAETDYLFYLLETENEHYFTNNYEDFEKKKEELGY